MVLEAVVLFSGPGGSSLGLRYAGVRHSVGVEHEANAVATARAAGFAAVHADVQSLSPSEVVREHLAVDSTRVLQASPPCQGLSAAGKGTGRQDLQHLLVALEGIAGAHVMDPDVCMYWSEWLHETCSDERSPLTFEMMRWIAELNPEYVMLEQVPSALPIWEAVAEVLRSWGYSVWCGNLFAEQYGVPQTRKRAFLTASRIHSVSAPVPTHSKYYSRSPEKLDEGVEKWISMAEALGWDGSDLVGFPRRADGVGEAVTIDDVAYRARDLRAADHPSMVVTGKSRSWQRFPEGVVTTGQNSRQAGGTSKLYERTVDAPAPTVTGNVKAWRVDIKPTHMGDVYNSNGCLRSVDEPAPTVTASMDNGNFRWLNAEEMDEALADRVRDRLPMPAIEGDTVEDLNWAYSRPSPTIVGSFAPEVVAKPGYRKAGDGPRQKTPGSVRVTVEEAGALQSFPWDYPWQGTKTRCYQQVGNAVPPVLQAVVAGQLLLPSTRAAA